MESKKYDVKTGDMIVSLRHLPEVPKTDDSIRIVRALAMDRSRILKFAAEKFEPNWANEAAQALSHQPSHCFIAIEGGKVVGFSCYDATAKDFFGPIGVDESMRGRKVGAALFIKTLEAMRDDGYVYAIIGWLSTAAGFYEKLLGAKFIDDSEPENSIYADRVEG